MKADSATGSLVAFGEESFHVAQKYQVLVLTDFCNECGNCVTFCPTAGHPYKDKPKNPLTERQVAKKRRLMKHVKRR